MLMLIIGFILGVVCYPWVSPIILPLVDKAKSFIKSKDVTNDIVETEDETESK